METNTNLNWDYTSNKMKELVSTTSDVVVHMITSFSRENLLNNTEIVILKNYLAGLQESDFDKQERTVGALKEKIDNLADGKLKDFIELLIYQAEEILDFNPKSIDVGGVLLTEYSTIADNSDNFFMFKDKDSGDDITNVSEIKNFDNRAFIAEAGKNLNKAVESILSKLNIRELY